MKSGLDSSHKDTSVRVQDDLFRHMNGQWLSTAEIPADRSGDGAFYWLRDEAEQKTREIIEATANTSYPHGSVGQKIGDLYKSYMNEAHAEELGISPIADDLASSLAITKKEEFLALLGRLEYEGLGGLFYGLITTDSGLSLPDESYYREDEYAPIREEFLTHATRMFAIAKIDGGAGHAKRILEVETELASFHWDQVRDRDATLTYNKATFAQLQELSPGLDWGTWNSGAKVPDHVMATTIVRQPSFFTGLGELLNNYENEKWRSWLTWQVLSSASSYLHAELVNENFAFYGTTLSGVPQLKERWKRGVGLVEGSLGEAVGQLYVEKHFPAEAKTRMQQLVKNLIEAYRVDIKTLDWMSPETKIRALEKLDKFTPKIGYPDKWRDYSDLHITPDDLIANLSAISTFTRNFELNKIGKPVDRTEWFMTPQTV
ncbi:MAG: peptidase M13, partial [Actinobacteria bacterium]|nr:peptidase M13 [Actinomycetota bacterium]